MPMRVPVVTPVIVAVRSVITPRRVSPIIVAVRMGAVVSPAYHDDRGRSDHQRRWDAEADVDIDASLSGLRLRQQCEAQERDHTTHAYDMHKTFHRHILAM